MLKAVVPEGKGKRVVNRRTGEVMMNKRGSECLAGGALELTNNGLGSRYLRRYTQAHVDEKPG